MPRLVVATKHLKVKRRVLGRSRHLEESNQCTNKLFTKMEFLGSLQVVKPLSKLVPVDTAEARC